MRAWLIPGAMLTLMTLILAGCDSNPEGPSAPAVPAGASSDAAAPSTEGAAKNVGGNRKGNSPAALSTQ